MNRKAFSLFPLVVLIAQLVGLRAQPAEAGIVEFSIPTPNSGPSRITAGSDGNLWFIEVNANQIGRITPDGSITEFPIPSFAPCGLARLGDITLGLDGNVWFTETCANKIGQITPAGVITEFTLGPPQVNAGPLSITGGPDGNLWFTYSGIGGIWRMTPTGTVTTFPVGDATGAGMTAGPDGNVWFAGGQIGRVTPAGVITEFPIPTSGGGGPGSITPAVDGNLWFTEPAGRKIGRITPSGAITEFPIPGAGPLTTPAGITSGPDGNLWFIVQEPPFFSSRGKVGRLTLAGFGEVANLAVGSFPTGITAGPDGNVWFTEFGANRVGRVATQPSVTISPGSGVYVSTQHFDVTLIVDGLGVPISGGQFTVDQTDGNGFLAACAIPGTVLSGGQTFRCPGLTGAVLGPGTHDLRVTLIFLDGSSAAGHVSWEILPNTEP